MKYLNGSCNCGKVEIKIPDDFELMGNCHCKECRKFSGGDYAVVGGLDSSKFEFVRGEDLVTYYPKSEETDLAFCSCCGSSLFSRKNSVHKHMVRLGILDDVPSSKPSFHIFTGEKAPWNEINDDLAQFDTRPPAK
ncbi:MAG: GFA family protein [Motiliproteus sp.]